jgi:MFS family permease
MSDDADVDVELQPSDEIDMLLGGLYLRCAFVLGVLLFSASALVIGSPVYIEDDLRAEFGVSADVLATASSALFAAWGVTAPYWGRASDARGRKAVLLVAVGVGVLGSAGSALSPRCVRDDVWHEDWAS